MNKKRALRPATEPIVFRPRSKPRLNFSSCTLNNDVLSLHHMTTVNLLSKQDSTIRTQITLTESLKQLVEKKAQALLLNILFLQEQIGKDQLPDYRRNRDRVAST